MGDFEKDLGDDYLKLREMFQQLHPELVPAFDRMEEDIMRHMARIRVETEAKLREGFSVEEGTEQIYKALWAQFGGTYPDLTLRRIARDAVPQIQAHFAVDWTDPHRREFPARMVTGISRMLKRDDALRPEDASVMANLAVEVAKKIWGNVRDAVPRGTSTELVLAPRGEVRYGLHQAGGQVPAGMLRLEEHPEFDGGVAIYPQELTDEDVSRWGLVPIVTPEQVVPHLVAGLEGHGTLAEALDLLETDAERFARDMARQALDLGVHVEGGRAALMAALEAELRRRTGRAAADPEAIRQELKAQIVAAAKAHEVYPVLESDLRQRQYGPAARTLARMLKGILGQMLAAGAQGAMSRAALRVLDGISGQLDPEGNDTFTKTVLYKLDDDRVAATPPAPPAVQEEQRTENGRYMLQARVRKVITTKYAVKLDQTITLARRDPHMARRQMHDLVEAALVAIVNEGLTGALPDHVMRLADTVQGELQVTGLDDFTVEVTNALGVIPAPKLEEPKVWVRKDVLERHDGQSKNIARGTRVRLFKDLVGADRYVMVKKGATGTVVESAAGNTSYQNRAKEILGTSSAVLVRLDPHWVGGNSKFAPRKATFADTAPQAEPAAFFVVTTRLPSHPDKPAAEEVTYGPFDTKELADSVAPDAWLRLKTWDGANEAHYRVQVLEKPKSTAVVQPAPNIWGAYASAETDLQAAGWTAVTKHGGDPLVPDWVTFVRPNPDGGRSVGELKRDAVTGNMVLTVTHETPTTEQKLNSRERKHLKPGETFGTPGVGPKQAAEKLEEILRERYGAASTTLRTMDARKMLKQLGNIHVSEADWLAAIEHGDYEGWWRADGSGAQNFRWFGGRTPGDAPGPGLPGKPANQDWDHYWEEHTDKWPLQSWYGPVSQYVESQGWKLENPAFPGSWTKLYLGRDLSGVPKIGHKLTIQPAPRGWDESGPTWAFWDDQSLSSTYRETAPTIQELFSAIEAYASKNRLVVGDQLRPEPKFEPGQLVRLTNSPTSVAKIEYVDRFDEFNQVYVYKVRVNGRLTTWNETGLELVPAEETPAVPRTQEAVPEVSRPTVPEAPQGVETPETAVQGILDALAYKYPQGGLVHRAYLQKLTQDVADVQLSESEWNQAFEIGAQRGLWKFVDERELAWVPPGLSAWKFDGDALFKATGFGNVERIATRKPFEIKLAPSDPSRPTKLDRLRLEWIPDGKRKAQAVQLKPDQYLVVVPKGLPLPASQDMSLYPSFDPRWVQTFEPEVPVGAWVWKDGKFEIKSTATPKALPQRGAAGAQEPAIKRSAGLTPKQFDLIERIVHDEHQNGDDPVENPVWSHGIFSQFGTGAGGVVAKAIEAGLVGSDAKPGGQNKESTIWVTQTGYDLYLAEEERREEIAGLILQAIQDVVATRNLTFEHRQLKALADRVLIEIAPHLHNTWWHTVPGADAVRQGVSRGVDKAPLLATTTTAGVGLARELADTIYGTLEAATRGAPPPPRGGGSPPGGSSGTRSPQTERQALQSSSKGEPQTWLRAAVLAPADGSRRGLAPGMRVRLTEDNRGADAYATVKAGATGTIVRAPATKEDRTAAIETLGTPQDVFLVQLDPGWSPGASQHRPRASGGAEAPSTAYYVVISGKGKSQPYYGPYDTVDEAQGELAYANEYIGKADDPSLWTASVQQLPRDVTKPIQRRAMEFRDWRFAQQELKRYGWRLVDTEGVDLGAPASGYFLRGQDEEGEARRNPDTGVYTFTHQAVAAAVPEPAAPEVSYEDQQPDLVVERQIEFTTPGGRTFKYDYPMVWGQKPRFEGDTWTQRSNIYSTDPSKAKVGAFAYGTHWGPTKPPRFHGDLSGLRFVVPGYLGVSQKDRIHVMETGDFGPVDTFEEALQEWSKRADAIMDFAAKHATPSSSLVAATSRSATPATWPSSSAPTPDPVHVEPDGLVTGDIILEYPGDKTEIGFVDVRGADRFILPLAVSVSGGRGRGGRFIMAVKHKETLDKLGAWFGDLRTAKAENLTPAKVKANPPKVIAEALEALGYKLEAGTRILQRGQGRRGGLKSGDFYYLGRVGEAPAVKPTAADPWLVPVEGEEVVGVVKQLRELQDGTEWLYGGTLARMASKNYGDSGAVSKAVGDLLRGEGYKVTTNMSHGTAHGSVTLKFDEKDRAAILEIISPSWSARGEAHFDATAEKQDTSDTQSDYYSPGGVRINPKYALKFLRYYVTAAHGYDSRGGFKEYRGPSALGRYLFQQREAVSAKPTTSTKSSTRKASTKTSSAVGTRESFDKGEQAASWVLPGYGEVKVIEGAQGKKDSWNNISAQIDGKRMRYGYSTTQGRWARGEEPPADLLATVASRGYGHLFGLEGGMDHYDEDLGQDTEGDTAAEDFASLFESAFNELSRDKFVGLVSLHELRARLPQFDRETFDRELYELRRQGHYVLQTHESRHGRASPEQLEAAIEEGGRRFIYVSRRKLGSSGAGSSSGDFGARFDAAFAQLERQHRVNLVPLADLRDVFPELNRSQFDQELYELRKQNRYVLDTFDGRHGALTEREKAAVIEEGGRRYVYASRRNKEPDTTVSVETPRAYLSPPLPDGRVTVIVQGSAVAQGTLPDMFAYLRKHFPQVPPTQFLEDGLFHPLEEEQGDTSGDFAPRFERAFDRLRAERRVNLVSISSLRQALSGVSREQFDRELYELRRQNRYVLETSESRHGKPKPEELEGAILEGGRRFVYVSKRDDAPGSGSSSSRQSQGSDRTPSGPIEFSGNFSQDFGAAFTRLRAERRTNLVPLLRLREALPEYPREEFDRNLYELRRQNRYVLESYDGRHGLPAQAEIDAGILEGGRRFVYVSKRDDAEEPEPPQASGPVSPATIYRLLVEEADRAGGVYSKTEFLPAAKKLFELVSKAAARVDWGSPMAERHIWTDLIKIIVHTKVEQLIQRRDEVGRRIVGLFPKR